MAGAVCRYSQRPTAWKQQRGEAKDGLDSERNWKKREEEEQESDKEGESEVTYRNTDFDLGAATDGPGATESRDHF